MNYTLNNIVAAIRANEHPQAGDTVVAWYSNSDWLTGFVIGRLIGIDDDKYIVRTAYTHTPIFEYECAVRISKCDDVRPPINYEEGA